MENVLDNIYRCKDKELYHVAVVDEELLHVSHKVCTSEELENLTKTEKCDFSFEHGILRCNSMLKISDITEDLFESLLRSEQSGNKGPDSSVVYSLFAMGIKEDFIILDGENETDWCKNIGIAAFRNIQFSKTTMSVYARMCNGEDGIFNKMIITSDNGVLTFHPFKFGICCDDNNTHVAISGCSNTGAVIKLHGRDYQVWETSLLNIYDANTEFSPAVVNQSMCDVQVMQTSLDMVNDFIAGLSGTEETYQWAGGSSDYSGQRGVYLESSCKKLSRKHMNGLKSAVLEALSEGKSEEDVKEAGFTYLKNVNNFDRLGAYVTIILTQLALHPGDFNEKLTFAFNTKKQIQNRLFWLNMYLYRVRTKALLEQRTLTSYGQPYLVGGNTREFTIVNSYSK